MCWNRSPHKRMATRNGFFYLFMFAAFTFTCEHPNGECAKVWTAEWQSVAVVAWKKFVYTRGRWNIPWEFRIYVESLSLLLQLISTHDQSPVTLTTEFEEIGNFWCQNRIWRVFSNHFRNDSSPGIVRKVLKRVVTRSAIQQLSKVECFVGINSTNTSSLSLLSWASFHSISLTLFTVFGESSVGFLHSPWNSIRKIFTPFYFVLTFSSCTTNTQWTSTKNVCLFCSAKRRVETKINTRRWNENHIDFIVFEYDVEYRSWFLRLFSISRCAAIFIRAHGTGCAILNFITIIMIIIEIVNEVCYFPRYMTARKVRIELRTAALLQFHWRRQNIRHQASFNWSMNGIIPCGLVDVMNANATHRNQLTRLTRGRRHTKYAFSFRS